MSDLRDKRFALGLCVQCGTIPDRIGTLCKRCNAMSNRNKHVRNCELHKQGICVNCGKSMDRVGWICIECVEITNARTRERNIYRRENGLCVQCGQVSDAGVYCRRCLDLLKARRSRRQRS